MAQIVSQRQGFAGKGTKLMGIIAVAFIAIAVALAVWAAFAASTPKVAPSTKAVPYLQDPGLLDQRAGERGLTVTVPAPSLLDPGMQLQRKGERGVLDAAPSGTSATLPNRVQISEGLQEQRRGERAGKTSTGTQIHQHRRGHSAGNS